MSTGRKPAEITGINVEHPVADDGTTGVIARDDAGAIVWEKYGYESQKRARQALLAWVKRTTPGAKPTVKPKEPGYKADARKEIARLEALRDKASAAADAAYAEAAWQQDIVVGYSNAVTTLRNAFDVGPS